VKEVLHGILLIGEASYVPLNLNDPNSMKLGRKHELFHLRAPNLLRAMQKIIPRGEVQWLRYTIAKPIPKLRCDRAMKHNVLRCPITEATNRDQNTPSFT